MPGFIPIALSAQSLDSFANVFQKSKAFYTQLDKIKRKTDLLLNYGFVILNETENCYEGRPIIADEKKWWYLYHSIRNSYIESDSNMQADSILKKSIKNKNAIAFLYFEADYLPYREVCKQYKDKTSELLYPDLLFFSGTILNSDNLDNEPVFEYSPKMLINNKADISQILIDFEDGAGYIKCKIGEEQNFKIHYNSTGEKSIKFKIITNKNDTLLSYSKINITETITHKKSKSLTDFWDGTINYRYLQGCDGVLDKPVLISEGFDLTGGMDLDKIEAHWNNGENPIINRLNAHGYDVYLINYENSDKTIQQNASAIKDLIKEINANKQGHYEGIYIGESMGGLTGRAALRELELEGYNHEFGLYVSFDSPQKGAYVPPGLQYLVYDILFSNGFSGIADVTDILELIFQVDIPFLDVYSMLNSASAKQLLIQHYTYPLSAATPDFVAFQHYLNGLGYPANARNISFVCGSNISENQGINSDFVVYYNPNTTFGLLPPYTFTFSFNAKFPTVGNGGSLEDVSNIGMYFQHIELEANETWSWVWNFFTGGFWQVYTEYSEIIVPDFNLGVTHWETKKPITYYNTPGSTKGLDQFSNTYLQMPFESNKFSFVPTLSALGYNQATESDAYFNIFNENSTINTNYLINNQLTPFDDIYSDNDNFEHPKHEDFNMEKSLEKMELMYDNTYLQNRIITKNTDFEASSQIIVGKNVTNLVEDIQNEAEDYSSFHTKNIKQGDFIIKNGAFVNMKAGDDIFFEDGFDAETGSEFSTEIGSVCSGVKSSNEFVEKPEIAGNKNIKGTASFVCTNCENSDVEWRLTGENTNLFYSCKEFLIQDSLPYGQYTLYCTKTSDEYTSTNSIVIKTAFPDILKKKITENKIENLDVKGIIIYPNPSSGKFTVQLNNNAKPGIIQIYDTEGKVILESEMKTLSQEFNLEHFNSGIYTIHITTLKKKYVEKLVLQK